MLTAIGLRDASSSRARTSGVLDRLALLRGVLPRALRRRAPRPARSALPHADPYLLPLVGLLTAIGLTLIYRIEPDLAFRQGVWVVVGVAVFALAVLVRRATTGASTPTSTRSGSSRSGSSLLPALPGLGATINGARLWVHVGPIAFQPGEFAKVLLVVFLAGYLRDNREMLSMGVGRCGLPSPKHFGPLLLIWGGAMLVLFQTNDLGGGLLYFSIFLAMLYVATARWPYVAVGLGLFAAGAVRRSTTWSRTSQSRVSIWLDPWQDPFDDGYQLVQSIYAISGGGVFGAGPRARACSCSPRAARTSPTSRPTSSTRRSSQELGLAGARGA